jgi:hypothetical protein
MNDLIMREDAIRDKKAQTLNANAEFMMGRLCNEDESRIYNIGFAEGWNAHFERCKGIPTAEPTVDKDYLVALIQEAVYDGEACKRLLDLVEPKQGEWIPIMWHEITDEEREEEDYPEDWTVFIDSEMPADGEQILVTTKRGEVERDTCLEDNGFYLDSGWDWIDDIVAWMPSPTAYKEGADDDTD